MARSARPSRLISCTGYQLDEEPLNPVPELSSGFVGAKAYCFNPWAHWHLTSFLPEHTTFLPRPYDLLFIATGSVSDCPAIGLARLPSFTWTAYTLRE